MPDVTPLVLKPIVLTPPLNVTVIRDVDGLAKLTDFFTRCDKVIGWDIETTPIKNFFWRRIRTIQFGDKNEQYCIDLRAFCGNDGDALSKAQGYYGLKIPDSLKPVIDTISPVVCSKDFLKVGVNLGFEYENFYWLLGLRTQGFFSCDMVERCIWAGAHSLKDYGFYSMEEMMARYFQVQIDKSLQESFNLDDELTPEQGNYACLDTRYPLALRAVQLLILAGETPASLTAKGQVGFANMLTRIGERGPQNAAGAMLLFGDNLTEIAKIENDAIGAFQDMHVYGERIDREKWKGLVAGKVAELTTLLKELDQIFLPIVGSKSVVISDADIEQAAAKWKAYNIISEEETKLKAEIRYEKLNVERAAELEAKRLALEAARKAEKEIHKKAASELGKKRTKIKNLALKCEGDALINYGSDAQLLKVLVGMKGLTKLTNLDDETLEKYEHIKVMSLIRKYHGLSKTIGTYGIQWATEWTTKPCSDEGWLNPNDGRLHSQFNQYDAATGRSSSEQPNGQNLPKDKEVRSCFIADPPDESIRITDCCNVDATTAGGILLPGYRQCPACGKNGPTHAEEYVIVTADMSGAELRILAEQANDPVWIGAFSRGEDVHSVCCEMMEGETWPKLALPDCAYYTVKPSGDLQRHKCKCPEHNEVRDGMKPTNFGIPYGISAIALSIQLKKTRDATQALMDKHKATFPIIWKYVDNSGLLAKVNKKAFDMYGRRRIFPEPTWERAREKAKEDREEKLRLPDEEAKHNIETFTTINGRKPLPEEKWILTHNQPSSGQVASAYAALHGSIERQGKNHEIQGTNATIAKLAMGCGHCPAGKPYLWHTLPTLGAKLIKFVHDELVVQCPKRYGPQVAALIGDAFKRAAAEKMKKVVMEFDYNIATYWKK